VKVLWVKSGGFLPLDAGGKIRSLNVARELARRHELSIFTYYPTLKPDPHETLRDHFRGETECLPIDLPERGSVYEMLWYVANSITKRPFQAAKYCRSHIRRRLRDKLSSRGYDIVICDYLLTAGVIPWDLRIPTVIFTHNVEAQIWKRHSLINNNPLWKMIAIREHRAIQAFERRFTALADHVSTVSEDDRREFLKFLPPNKVSTIPTGVDTDYFRPQTAHSDGHSLVFTGSMDWKPNQDAILHFVDSIFPLIQREVPDVVLRIVGRRPSRKILALKEKNPAIQVTGTVDDVRPYVHESSVYVVPLRIGSGTRIKIFEAMAMGIPVVSTTLGAEGLPVQHDRNILLADDPVDFAARTVALLTQSALRERFGREARSLAERCNWAAAGEAFDKVLHKVVQSTNCVLVNN